MNEVEKMYRNSGIKEIELDYPDNFEPFYPEFTAEKQLKLIKWLSRRRLLNIAFSNDKSTYQLFNDKCTGNFCRDLATAIATLVQCELDFCTEEERKQIKEILNE